MIYMSCHDVGISVKVVGNRKAISMEDVVNLNLHEWIKRFDLEYDHIHCLYLFPEE